MGLYVNQETTRTKLQERIAADLAEKAKKKPDLTFTEGPDGVEDSAYLEETKKTTSLAWAWVLIAIFGIGIAVTFMLMSMKQY